MKALTKRLTTSAAVAALGVSMMFAGAGEASATNVVDCGNRIDFVSVTLQWGARYCFAYAGTTEMNWAGVVRLTSGNNRVAFTYRLRGGDQIQRITVEKWFDSGIQPADTLLKIEVF